MTAATFPRPVRPFRLLTGLRDRLRPRTATRSAPRTEDAPGADTTRDRRAFITDMLDRNADAFATEQDVAAMMGYFTGRF